MTTSNTDINNICNQFKISKEDEIKFNKLRDEIASLGQQIIALNETRFVAINKMQELLDKYTIDQKTVNNFINNVEKYPTTTIINDKHISKTAPKAVIDESEPAEESRSKKVVKKKPATKTPKKSGAAAMKIEDEEEPEAETHDEPEPEPEKEPENQEETEETVETHDETEQETQENEEENQETEEDKPVKKTAKKAPVKKATTAKKAPVKKATTPKKVPAKKTTIAKKVPAKNSD